MARPAGGKQRSTRETIEPPHLNHLRIFARVAALASFSAAARSLRLPKSNVSRSIAKLEATLGTRLFQRTTRNVVLTSAGKALRARCKALLEGLDEAIAYVSGLADIPRGHLKISAGIGSGINVLSDLLSTFLDRYPELRVTLDLSTRHTDLVAEKVDCALRLGPLPDSALVTTRLGARNRCVCASPAYLAKRGTPASLDDLARHDTIEMPGADERALPRLLRKAGKTVPIDPNPRASASTRCLPSIGWWRTVPASAC